GHQVLPAGKGARPPRPWGWSHRSVERSGRCGGRRPPLGAGRGAEAGAVLLPSPATHLDGEPGDPRKRRSPAPDAGDPPGGAPLGLIDSPRARANHGGTGQPLDCLRTLDSYPAWPLRRYRSVADCRGYLVYDGVPALAAPPRDMDPACSRHVRRRSDSLCGRRRDETRRGRRYLGCCGVDPGGPAELRVPFWCESSRSGDVYGCSRRAGRGGVAGELLPGSEDHPVDALHCTAAVRAVLPTSNIQRPLSAFEFWVVAGASVFLLLGGWILGLGARNVWRALASPEWPKSRGIVVTSDTGSHVTTDKRTRTSTTMYSANIRFKY